MFINRLLGNLSWRLSKKCVSSLFNVPNRCEMDKAYCIAENKIEVDNIEINCLQTGSGEHKVFLLPGSVGTIWTDFSPQISGLESKEFTIVAWDPPGYGSSRPPERDFSDGFYERDADMAVKLLKTLGIQKCSLLGWSDGGITSLIIAAKYPEIVQKLVVWGANAFVNYEDIAMYEKIRNIDQWSEGMRNTMTSIYGHEGLQSLMNKWTDAMIEIKEKHNGDICKEMVTKIVAPTLILHGERDPLVSKKHYTFLHKSIPGSKLHLFEDGKHNIHLKHADSFNKIVQSFLQRRTG